MIPRLLLRIVPAVVLVAAVGCGLADYQEKMKKSQAAAERFDEEVKLLDEVAKIPMMKKLNPELKKEEDVPMVDLFVVLPRGIISKPNPVALNGRLWQYPRKPTKAATPPGPGLPPAPPPAAPPQPGVPVPAAKPAGPPTDVLEVFLAWDREEKRDKFEQFVIGCFHHRGEVVKRSWTTLAPEPARSITYETYEFWDQAENFYSVSFRTLKTPKEKDPTKEDALNVAIAFRVERVKPPAGQPAGTPQQAVISPEANKTIQLCLDWVGVGLAESVMVGQVYKRRISAAAPPAPPPGTPPGTPPGAPPGTPQLPNK